VAVPSIYLPVIEAIHKIIDEIIDEMNERRYSKEVSEASGRVSSLSRKWPIK